MGVANQFCWLGTNGGCILLVELLSCLIVELWNCGVGKWNTLEWCNMKSQIWTIYQFLVNLIKILK